jgi:DNA ligase-1
MEGRGRNTGRHPAGAAVIKKPMLAETCEDIAALRYPVYASQKVDGIRCLKVNGQAVSRKFKPIPNHHIRQTIERLCTDGMDGEIIIPGASFNQIQSLVMSEQGEPDFVYLAFDYVATDLSEPFAARIERLTEWKGQNPSKVVLVLPQLLVADAASLIELEEKLVASGAEGVMVRHPGGPYKCGRSTAREGYLLKIKRFEDSEAEVIGFEEQLRNENEAQKDALGHTKRSSHKANLVPAGTLGKFLVREIGDTAWKGREFAIGTGEGLTHALRKEVWDNQAAYLGRIITYKFQPHGMKDLPRIPIFRGFRDPRDMS